MTDHGTDAMRDGWSWPASSSPRWRCRSPSYMREWCRREDFRNALPLLLRGEDPEFQDYIRRVAEEEGGSIIVSTL
jgi:hypothetical protein